MKRLSTSARLVTMLRRLGVALVLVGSLLAGCGSQPSPSGSGSAPPPPSGSSDPSFPVTTSPTPSEVPAPGRGWIAVTRDEQPGEGRRSELFLVRPDGTELRPIMPGLELVGDPRMWSPDGRLLHVIEVTGESDTHVIVDADTGTLTRLDPGPGGWSRWSWSPDSTMAAVEHEGEGDMALALLTVAGGTPRFVAPDEPGRPVGDIMWSPDGSMLAVAWMADLGAGAAYSVHLVDVATGTSQVVHGPGAEEAGQPRWSPDGSRIAFRVRIGDEDDEDSEIDLRILDVAAGTAQSIRIPFYAVDGLTWSPDGSLIAMSIDDGGGGSPTEVLVLDPRDGSVIRDEGLPVDQIDTGPPPDPWAPGDLALGYDSIPDWPGGERHQIRVLEPGVPAGRWLTDDPATCGIDPHWSPDGSTIAYVRTRYVEGTGGQLGQCAPAADEGLFAIDRAGGAPRLVLNGEILAHAWQPAS